jgi:hypothetical protein
MNQRSMEHCTPFVPSSQYVLFEGEVLAPFHTPLSAVVHFDFLSGPFWDHVVSQIAKNQYDTITSPQAIRTKAIV